MAISWTKEYDGAAEPDSGGAYDWTLDGTDHSTSDGDILNIDTTSQGTDKCAYYQAPDVDFDAGFTLETRIKFNSRESSGYFTAAYIRDGTQSEFVTFQMLETGIGCNGSWYWSINPTDGYHIYRITVDGTTVKVYVDGVEAISETVNSGAGADRVVFGDWVSTDTYNFDADIDYFNYILGSAIGCFNKTATDGITLSDSNHETYPVITARHMRPKVILIRGRL